MFVRPTVAFAGKTTQASALMRVALARLLRSTAKAAGNQVL